MHKLGGGTPPQFRTYLQGPLSRSLRWVAPKGVILVIAPLLLTLQVLLTSVTEPIISIVLPSKPHGNCEKKNVSRMRICRTAAHNRFTIKDLAQYAGRIFLSYDPQGEGNALVSWL